MAAVSVGLAVCGSMTPVNGGRTPGLGTALVALLEPAEPGDRSPVGLFGEVDDERRTAILGAAGQLLASVLSNDLVGWFLRPTDGPLLARFTGSVDDPATAWTLEDALRLAGDEQRPVTIDRDGSICFATATGRGASIGVCGSLGRRAPEVLRFVQSVALVCHLADPPSIAVRAVR